jgi:hypothetical protein
MTLPSDPVQQLSEATVAILNTAPVIVAITGRSSDNIVRWRRRKASALPRLAYVFGPTEIAGGLGETYDVDGVLRAEAKDAATANALLRAALELLTPMAYQAQGCDALITDWTYDNPPDDQGDPPTDANAVVAEADLTVNLTL